MGRGVAGELGLLDPARALCVPEGRHRGRRAGADGAHAARRARGAVRGDARRPLLAHARSCCGARCCAPWRCSQRPARWPSRRRSGVVLVFATVFTIANTAHRPAQAALMPQARAHTRRAGRRQRLLERDRLLRLPARQRARGRARRACRVRRLASRRARAAFALTALVVAPLAKDPRPEPLPGQAGGGLAELSDGHPHGRRASGHPRTGRRLRGQHADHGHARRAHRGGRDRVARAG